MDIKATLKFENVIQKLIKYAELAKQPLCIRFERVNQGSELHPGQHLRYP
jgi:hypothetical protein